MSYHQGTYTSITLEKYCANYLCIFRAQEGEATETNSARTVTISGTPQSAQMAQIIISQKLNSARDDISPTGGRSSRPKDKKGKDDNRQR